MKIVILRFPAVDPALSDMICFMAERLGYEIVGFVSFDTDEHSKSVNGFPVYEMMQIYDLTWDIAIYAYPDEDFETIRPRLIKLQMGTDEQFKNINWLLQQTMIKKYEDFKDPDIQATLKYWKTNELSVFNQHIKEATLDKLHLDATCKLPYINFKTIGGELRRMYYPNDYDFYTFNEEKYVSNVWT